MMADIWVIETGKYSSYYVVGVFSTEENARQVADKLDSKKEEWEDKCRVNKWVLDPGIGEVNQGLVGFRISMRIDGTVCLIIREDKLCKQKLTTKIEVDRNLPGVYGTVLARDEEHAIKIANEHRAQFIANWEL